MLRALIRPALVLTLALALLVLYDKRAPISTPPIAPLTAQIDRIVIEKSARRLMLFRGDEVVREYRVALGFAPDGDKIREGDGKTPEGLFAINRRNAGSAYHLSLGLDYPRPEDIARAAADGVSPGGDIFIHGQPNGLNRIAAIASDWTAGCVALSNAEIEEIWQVTPIGTPVEVRP